MAWLGQRIVLVLIAATLAGCAAGDAVPTAEPAADVARAGQVIALAGDDRTRDGLIAAAEARGYRPLSGTELPALGYAMLTFGLPAGVSETAAIEALETAVPGSVVGMNHAYRPQATRQIATDRRDYATALLGWPSGGCDAMVPVGLVDTAVDRTAPALANARIVERQFSDAPSADTRHGTELASVLADPARLRGVTIYSANVVGAIPGSGDAAGTDALIRAIDWLAGQQIPIVNIALAGPYNKLLELAVASATARGVVIVAAVGNAGPDVDPQYPAAFDAVIAVTAVDADRRLFRNAVRGRHVDIAAPGVDIFVPTGASARFVTGTSIATAFVTAWIAADAELIARSGAEAADRRLREASEDLGADGPDPLFGAGLLNAQDLCRG